MGVDESAPAKLRWGELDEDDGDDLGFLLPPKQVIGPDAGGVKKVIECRFNDDGNQVKITTTTRVKRAEVRLNKRAVERRSWLKFGDAVHGDVGESLTVVSTEEILLERPGAPGMPSEQKKKTVEDGGGHLMLCRSCGKRGDHWTARCPYKDLALPTDDSSVDDKRSAHVTTDQGTAKKDIYVPKFIREGGLAKPSFGQDIKRRNDENSVRVSNLSEDTLEPDLRELFSTFGPVSRAHVVIDQKTGESRGFGFVNFVNKEDGGRAIKKLNGYGYDNLILRVEWAMPRAA